MKTHFPTTRSRTDKVTMAQISPGTLRAYLDDDPALDAAGRAHVAEMLATDPATATSLEALRAERAITGSIFAPLAVPMPDTATVERAYRRTLARTASYRRGPLTLLREAGSAIAAPFRATRAGRYAIAGSIALVALALVMVFAPVGSIVSATLDQFRYQPDKFAVITLDTNTVPGLSFAQMGNTGSGLPLIPSGSSAGAGMGATSGLATIPTGGSGSGVATPGPLGAIPSGGTNGGTKPGAAVANNNPLGALAPYLSIAPSSRTGASGTNAPSGNSGVTGQPPAHLARNAAEVQAITGHSVLLPTTLPDGVPNKPLFLVSDPQTVDAALDLKGLRPALAAAGGDGLLPTTSDTAPVHVHLPATSITTYGLNPLALLAGGTAATNQKGIAVIELETPTISVENVDIQTLASTLALIPGIPPTLAAQLRSADLSHTLVVPVTADQTVKNGTFINGNASTLIAQRDGSSAIALWFNRGILYVVVGTYDGATVQRVAQSIK